MEKLNYDKIFELRREGITICGYIREPEVYKENIYGMCALNGNNCRKRLKDDCLECKTYKDFFNL